MKSDFVSGVVGGFALGVGFAIAWRIVGPVFQFIADKF
jgi:hypothetical protein